jgi:predicted transcriptional regulator
VAYPKKDPAKQSVNAGVSLPSDVKRRVTALAEAQNKSLSRYVYELVLKQLEKADAALDRGAKANATKVNTSVKKRR